MAHNVFYRYIKNFARILFLPYNIKSAVRNQSPWEAHGAVRLLEIFQNGYNGAGNGDCRSIQHVDIFIFTVIVLKADVKTTRLIIGTV